MANTNRPTAATHQQIIIPPNGSSYAAGVSTGHKYINCYPRIDKQIGRDPEYSVLRRPPVQQVPANVGLVPTNGRVMASYHDQVTGILWLSFSDSVVRISANGTVATHQAVGMGTNIIASWFAKYKVGSTEWIICLRQDALTSVRLCFFTILGTLDQIYQPSNTVLQSNKIVFMDGYFFLASLNRQHQRIYNTTLGTPNEIVHSVSFLDAEQESDYIVTLSKHHNHIVAMGSDTIEFFYNSSNELGSPLSRQASYSQKIGVYDPSLAGTIGYPSNKTVLEVGDEIYFVGAINGNVQGLYRIKRFAVEKLTNDYDTEVLRRFSNPALCTFDLNGEMCVMIIDELNIMSPRLFIPSLGIFVQFTYEFNPIHSIAFGVGSRKNVTLLFRAGVTSFLYNSGTTTWITQSPILETFIATIQEDYQDFNNNSRKHWKAVDVLGHYGINTLVGIGYRNDNYGLDNAKLVNLPYLNQTNLGKENALRWRNLGQSRRQAITVFINGADDFVYKGLCINYNQWSD